MLSGLVLGGLALVWPAVHGLAQQRGLLAVAPQSRRIVAGGWAVTWIGLSLLTAAAASALTVVPAGLVGNLGFFPLLRGLGGLLAVSFVAPAPAPPRRQPDGSLSLREVARVSLRGGVDLVALLLPVLALLTSAEWLELGAGFALLVITVPLVAARGPAPMESRRVSGARLRPWAQLGVGIGVLYLSGSFGWLLHARR